jgi:hypothetical protein
MRRAQLAPVIDLKDLEGTLDLWGCMWSAEEQQAFETALVLALTDAHSRATRMRALAACHVIATQRLLGAAARVAESGVFTAAELASIEETTLPIHRRLRQVERLRGDLGAVERLLAHVVDGEASGRSEVDVLDGIDLRDLVAVARTTLDARLFGEIDRRIARRGRYQRARAKHLLGWEVRFPGNWDYQSPEIGESERVSLRASRA